ncbi:anthranilate synthase component I [Halorientalis regularis]|jgi:anthranilate synthase component 1|uniref:Anthranilate synthase component 1 n=1 Tax=Halorientalis regularis TaxID=660518 RepID=A0A1G7M585_9EURY|nr:anthranilate synthase component I [Halorientalis regularis]SDF56932.1 anthranilate synthase, component I [Halorientalis regularis]
MIDTSREEFVELADTDGPAVVRVAADLPADVEPLAAYAALTGRTTDAEPAPYAFLLESAEKVASSDPDGAFAPTKEERHARYSFVGYDPEAVVTVDSSGAGVETFDDRYAGLVATDASADPDPVDHLRHALPDATLRGFNGADRQHLDGGLVGFLAYDAVYDMWLDEVGLDHPDGRLPDAQFVLNTKTLVFDDRDDTVSLVFTPLVTPDEDAGERYDELEAEAERVAALLDADVAVETGGFALDAERADPRADYEQAVERAKEHVLDGDIYQGVISRKRELDGDVDPLAFYDSLREVNPSPYMYLLGYDGLTVVGASPETLISVRDDRIVSNPIAGTCDRGTSPVEDRRLAGEMLADGKERAEHTMLVDLARNDVRRVAQAGSVRVEEFMNVLKYSHVQHIESTVTGTLADDADQFDATRAAFPAGTLSGAPKIRAMEIIDDLEPEPRGLYGGGVGYYSWTGDTDFAIVIRTATVESGTGPYTADRDDDLDRITVQAGAGIVADSDPASEYYETEKKMDGVLTALDAIADEPVEADAHPGPAGEKEGAEEVSR